MLHKINMPGLEISPGSCLTVNYVFELQVWKTVLFWMTIKLKKLFIDYTSDREDTEKKKQVLIVSDSLFRSIEAPPASLTESHERCADFPELTCCWESSTTCQDHRLLSVAPLSCGHEWHCKLEPGQHLGKLQSPGSARIKYCCQSFLFFHFTG